MTSPTPPRQRKTTVFAVQPEKSFREARVLIADRESNLLAKGLVSRGYEVASATAHAQIQQACAEFHPEIVLCDIGFFNCDGPTYVKPDGIAAEIPCIGMGRDADAHSVASAFRAGICDFFEKTASLDEIHAIIQGILLHRADGEHDEISYETLWQAKEAAEASSRAKSEFLATISHELRTPLNAIIGFSDLMIRGVLGPLGNPKYRGYIEDIHRSGTHLLSIINDILDFSKAEAGKLTLDEEEIDVVDVVKSVVRLMGPRVEDGRLTLDLHLPSELPRLWCDQRKLKQMLLNLLSNAVKFTPPGNNVEVRAHRSALGLEIHICDSGIGIAPSDLERVLQPFEQADNKLSRSHEGTGLGLTLVRSMIEIHGGTLRLESEVGVGTTAILTFPPHRIIALRGG